MKIQLGSKSSSPVLIFFFFLLILLMSCTMSTTEANTYEPSGRLRGGKPPSKFHGTKAKLTINSFQKGGDGGGPSECDGKFHSDDTRIVALSTRWFNHKKRCQKNIIINGNGRSVKAKVVDECDSRRGCANNIVDASKAVWKALGVPKKDWGLLDVTWSDA